jgi:hypothetical protein
VTFCFDPILVFFSNFFSSTLTFAHISKVRRTIRNGIMTNVQARRSVGSSCDSVMYSHSGKKKTGQRLDILCVIAEDIKSGKDVYGGH